ncbi:hypothetical protein HDV03_002684 [Kappamyces sp. JEL0829]|nr:hypothetical protein HDV03_002684 [Kappamyces sp. JEL0829]
MPPPLSRDYFSLQDQCKPLLSQMLVSSDETQLESCSIMTPVSDLSIQTSICTKSRKRTPSRSPSALQVSRCGREEAAGFIFSLGIGQDSGSIIKPVNYEPIPYRIPTGLYRKAAAAPPKYQVQGTGRKRSLLAALDVSIKEKTPRRATRLGSSPQTVSAAKRSGTTRTVTLATRFPSSPLKASLELPVAISTPLTPVGESVTPESLPSYLEKDEQ